MKRSIAHRPIVLAFWISVGVAGVLCWVMVATASAPLEDHFGLSPVPGASGNGVTIDKSPGANCTMAPIVSVGAAPEDIEVTGTQTTRCPIPARNTNGMTHEVAAGLLIPVISLSLFFLTWWALRRRPAWWPINALALVVSLGFLVAGYWNYVTTGVATVDGAPHGSTNQDSTEARLVRTFFSIGIGGTIGAVATLSTDWLIHRLEHTVEKLNDEQERKAKGIRARELREEKSEPESIET